MCGDWNESLHLKGSSQILSFWRSLPRGTPFLSVSCIQLSCENIVCNSGSYIMKLNKLDPKYLRRLPSSSESVISWNNRLKWTLPQSMAEASEGPLWKTGWSCEPIMSICKCSGWWHRDLWFPLLAKENVDQAAWLSAHSSAAETGFGDLMGWTPRFIIQFGLIKMFSMLPG